MLAHCRALLQHMKTDKKGVTALEYGVIASLAVVALGAAFTALYGAMSTMFASISATL